MDDQNLVQENNRSRTSSGEITATVYAAPAGLNTEHLGICLEQWQTDNQGVIIPKF